MNSLDQFLSELDVWPQAYEVNEASDFAQEKANEYLHDLDPNATLTVENGEVYVQADEYLEEEYRRNLQTIFDENFSDKLNEIQSKQIVSFDDLDEENKLQAALDMFDIYSQYNEYEGESEEDLLKEIEEGSSHCDDFTFYLNPNNEVITVRK